MWKLQSECVKEKTPQPELPPKLTIEGEITVHTIAGDRMTVRRRLNTNLMGPAG